MDGLKSTTVKEFIAQELVSATDQDFPPPQSWSLGLYQHHTPTRAQMRGLCVPLPLISSHSLFFLFTNHTGVSEPIPAFFLNVKPTLAEQRLPSDPNSFTQWLCSLCLSALLLCVYFQNKVSTETFQTYKRWIHVLTGIPLTKSKGAQSLSWGSLLLCPWRRFSSSPYTVKNWYY